MNYEEQQQYQQRALAEISSVLENFDLARANAALGSVTWFQGQHPDPLNEDLQTKITELEARIALETGG